MTLMFVILLFSSSLSDRDRSDRFLLELPCVILIIGLSSNSLAPFDSVLLTLLGLRYLRLELTVALAVAGAVVVVVVLPLSLYLEIEPELAETLSILDLDGVDDGVVYLLDPLPRNLLLDVEASV